MKKYKDEVRGFANLINTELVSLGKTHRDLINEIKVYDKYGKRKVITDQTLSNWFGGLVKLETFKDAVFAALNELKK